MMSDLKKTPKQIATAKNQKDNTKVFSIKIQKSQFDLFDRFAKVDGETNVAKLKSLLDFWEQNK